MSEYEKLPEIQTFREYLKIPSVHPDIDYAPCVQFLTGLADKIGLKSKIFYPKNVNRPIFIMEWTGSDPKLPSILLSSHMDVVPVTEENWTYPPFSAYMDEKGDIYARGAQDVKCLGIMNYYAVKTLKDAGVKLLRTVYICFTCEEEKGGFDGMRDFVHTDGFKQLNVGLSLDEAGVSPKEWFPCFYAERTCWQPTFICPGTSGHGSIPYPNTAGEKLRHIIDQMMDFRQQEVDRLELNPKLLVSDVTTVNLTRVSGGVQNNVVPEELSVTFDMRIAVDVNLDKLLERMEGWCREAGEGCRIEFYSKGVAVPPTKTDENNKFWPAFKRAIDDMGCKLLVAVSPGSTDAKHVRSVGIPALGFSPINFTEIRMHGDKEYLNAKTFLKGIEIMKNIIVAVANVKD